MSLRRYMIRTGVDIDRVYRAAKAAGVSGAELIRQVMDKACTEILKDRPLTETKPDSKV